MSNSVAVVIPTCDRHEDVVRAVDSCKAQEVKPTQIIVVDNGSDQSTIEQNKSIEGIIHLTMSQPNVSEARNYGVSQASADFVAFLDDDDVFLPNKLKTQLIMFKESQFDIGVLGCLSTTQQPNIPMVQVQLEHAFETCVMYPSSIMCPIGVALATPFNESINYGEDYEWMIRCVRDNMVIRTEHRLFQRSTTPNGRTSQFTDDFDNIRKRILEQLLTDEMGTESEFRDALSAFLRENYS